MVNPTYFTDTSEGRGSDLVRYMDRTGNDIQDIRNAVISEKENSLRNYKDSPYWEDRVVLSGSTFKDSLNESSWRTVPSSNAVYGRNALLRFP